MNIKEIFGADVYRDGGSYGFFFHSDDGKWYEFHIKRDRTMQTVDDYFPPRIYLEGCNSKNIVREFGWSEAKLFIKNLHYDNSRFLELIEIVNNNGKFT